MLELVDHVTPRRRSRDADRNSGCAGFADAVITSNCKSTLQSTHRNDINDQRRSLRFADRQLASSRSVTAQIKPRVALRHVLGMRRSAIASRVCWPWR
jgi:hypothetical protein